MGGYNIPILEQKPFSEVFEPKMIFNNLVYGIKGLDHNHNYIWSYEMNKLYMYGKNNGLCLGRFLGLLSKEHFDIIKLELPRLIGNLQEMEVTR